MRRLLLLSVLLACGCLVEPSKRPDKPVDPVNPTPTPIIKTLVPAAVFAALADDIDAGHLTSSVRLGQVVLALNRESKLDDDAFQKFSAAFPGISTERPLEATDAKMLRSLK
jgi:hypothetical protein